MQKKLIALAVAGLVSGAAFAQSNVTVYGVADLYFAHATAKETASTNVINSGGLSGSRIGFKGTEDIGGGMSALFVLEYALSLDTNDGVGQDYSLLGVSNNKARQQLLGVTGGFGTVVAGYAQTAGYDFACATSNFAGSAIDSYGKVGAAAVVSCGKSGRAGNAFAYISPSFGGVTFAYNHARLTEAAGALGGAASGPNDNYANLLGVTYAAGPVAVRGIYSNIRGTSAESNDDTNELGINGSYNFGVAQLFASYQTVDNKAVNGKNKKFGLSVTVPVGAAGGVHVGYAASKINEDGAVDLKNDVKSYTVAYTHGLSKRTVAYAGYNRVNNQDDGVAASVLPPEVAGGKSDVLAVGVRHTF
jgi:predicted porin